MTDTSNDSASLPEGSPPAEAPAPSPDVTAESSAAPNSDVNAEGSSPSQEGVESRKTLLDVTREVLAQSRQELPETPAPPAEQSPQADPPADPVLNADAPIDRDDTAEDDFTDSEALPFGKHPRFKKLLKQWKSDKEPANQFRQVQAFLDQNGVPPDLAAEGLKQVALLQQARRGSVEHARLFLQDIDKFRSEVRQMLGEDLPEDLREKVDSGLIDEASAKELTQVRTRLTLTQAEREAEAARSAQNARQSAAQAARTAVQDWEKQVRGLDADYARKAPMVLRTAKALAAERGAPRTAEEAVDLAKAAYEEVNTYLKSVMPAPRPSTPAAPRTPGGPTSLARPEPKTLLDVVRVAAAQARAS